MVDKNRIAFINCRTYSGGSGLITMPFAFNALLKLKRTFQIDLFLGEAPDPEYAPHLSKNVRVRHIDGALRRRSYLKEAELLISCSRLGYSAVFAVGQVGVAIGHNLARLNRCPLIIFNDEFPSCWGPSRWSAREIAGLRAADLIVVPDIGRAAQLRKEISVAEERRIFELPNVPLEVTTDATIDWHRRLNLPAGAIPLLCAGGMGEHNQIPELLCSARSWPERFVLILRGNSPTIGKQYRDQLSHLDAPGRVFWFFDPLSTNEFDSLVAYCAISFALYRDYGLNMTQMGKASGKLLRSIKAGVPVITSRFASLSFVESEGLGALVTHPAEISGAIESISSDASGYHERCLAFARCHLDYDNGWYSFQNALQALVPHTLAQ